MYDILFSPPFHSHSAIREGNGVIETIDERESKGSLVRDGGDVKRRKKSKSRQLEKIKKRKKRENSYELVLPLRLDFFNLLFI